MVEHGDSIVLCKNYYFPVISCLFKAMSEAEALENCECPADCNSNRYSYSVSSTVLDPDVICKHQEEYFSAPEYVGVPMLMRNFETMAKGTDMGTDQVCRRMVGRVAFVDFQLAGQIAMQFKNKLRVSFADQIANFGEGTCKSIAF